MTSLHTREILLISSVVTSGKAELVILFVMAPIEERSDAILRLYRSAGGDAKVIELEEYGYVLPCGMIQASSLISSIVAGINAW